MLPNKITVLEILETVEINDTVIDLCKDIKKAGYEIALDDFVYNGTSPILNIANFIKIDIMAYERSAIAEI